MCVSALGALCYHIGYILTPCTLRSLDMGVALKEGIFVAIQ